MNENKKSILIRLAKLFPLKSGKLPPTKFVQEVQCNHERIGSHSTDAWCIDCGQSV